jgi:hypothetical protein
LILGKLVGSSIKGTIDDRRPRHRSEEDRPQSGGLSSIARCAEKFAHRADRRRQTRKMVRARETSRRGLQIALPPAAVPTDRLARLLFCPKQVTNPAVCFMTRTEGTSHHMCEHLCGLFHTS